MADEALKCGGCSEELQEGQPCWAFPPQVLCQRCAEAQGLIDFAIADLARNYRRLKSARPVSEVKAEEADAST